MPSSVLQITAVQTAPAKTPYLYTVVLNLLFSLQAAKQCLALGASSAGHVVVDMSSLTTVHKVTENVRDKLGKVLGFQSSINSLSKLPRKSIEPCSDLHTVSVFPRTTLHNKTG